MVVKYHTPPPKFYIGSNAYNERSDLEVLFFEFVSKLKNDQSMHKKTYRNLVNLQKLIPYLVDKFRFHEYRWVFSCLDVELIDVIKHVINYGNIRDTNLTIYVNGGKNSTRKATTLIV